MTTEKPLASSKEVAEFIGVTPNALSKMRMAGDGPAFIRVGARNIKYSWKDVHAWISERRHTTTDEYIDQERTTP